MRSSGDLFGDDDDEELARIVDEWENGNKLGIDRSIDSESEAEKKLDSMAALMFSEAVAPETEEIVMSENPSTVDEFDEDEASGVSVGIDLGTTNSAVAAMVGILFYFVYLCYCPVNK